MSRKYDSHPTGLPRTRARRLRKTTVAISVAALAIVTASCSSTGSTPAGGAGGTAPAATQTLTYGLSSEPAAFRTGVNQGTAARVVLTLTQRGLMVYDNAGKPVPALAKSYNVSDDGLTYTFTLRPDLTFSDGSALTSKNVKDTFNYLAKPENGADAQQAFANIASVATPSPNRVIIKLKNPLTAFLSILADPESAIVPPPALSGKPNTFGAGPFKIQTYNRGQNMVLVPYKGYFDAAAVKLQKIDLVFMSDEQARVKAIQTGTVDMTAYIPDSSYATLEKDPNVNFLRTQGIISYVIANLKNKPLSNKKVRQAISYAISRDDVNQANTFGNGVPISGIPIVSSSPYYSKQDANPFGQDVAKAKQLMKEAGYASGFKLTILTNSQYFGYQQTAEVLKSELSKIGIDATIDTGDYATQIKKGNSAQYDLEVAALGGITNDPYYLNAAFLGSPTYNRSAGINQSLYSGLLQKANQTPDGPDREAIYKQIASVYNDDVPFFTMGQAAFAYALSPKLKGFKPLSGIIVYNSTYQLATAYMAK